MEESAAYVRLLAIAADARAAPFTLLACVVLSDTLEDNCGQLTVHPGDHHTLAAVIRREGAGFVTAHGPRPHLTAPAHQVKARAGDVVFAHPMLPHKVIALRVFGGAERQALHALLRCCPPLLLLRRWESTTRLPSDTQ